MSRRGSALVRTLAVLGGLLLLIWVGMQLFETEEDRLGRAVDAAQEALNSGDDAAFLAFFSDDVTYQGGDFEDLEVDLGRWRRVGIKEIYVTEREITLTDAGAEIRLQVSAGSPYLGAPRVDVLLRAGMEGSTWRVQRFEWTRK